MGVDCTDEVDPLFGAMLQQRAPVDAIGRLFWLVADPKTPTKSASLFSLYIRVRQANMDLNAVGFAAVLIASGPNERTAKTFDTCCEKVPRTKWGVEGYRCMMQALPMLRGRQSTYYNENVVFDLLKTLRQQHGSVPPDVYASAVNFLAVDRLDALMKLVREMPTHWAPETTAAVIRAFASRAPKKAVARGTSAADKMLWGFADEAIELFLSRAQSPSLANYHEALKAACCSASPAPCAVRLLEAITDHNLEVTHVTYKLAVFACRVEGRAEELLSLMRDQGINTEGLNEEFDMPEDPAPPRQARPPAATPRPVAKETPRPVAKETPRPVPKQTPPPQYGSSESLWGATNTAKEPPRAAGKAPAAAPKTTPKAGPGPAGLFAVRSSAKPAWTEEKPDPYASYDDGRGRKRAASPGTASTKRVKGEWTLPTSAKRATAKGFPHAVEVGYLWAGLTKEAFESFLQEALSKRGPALDRARYKVRRGSVSAVYKRTCVLYFRSETDSKWVLDRLQGHEWKREPMGMMGSKLWAARPSALD